MKKTLLAEVAALSVLSASAAHADSVLLKLKTDSGQIRRQAQQTAAAFAEAAAPEFDSSAFEDVPASLDFEWLRACVDYLAQRDA